MEIAVQYCPCGSEDILAGAGGEFWLGFAMHWLLGSLLRLMGLSMYAIILADPCGVRIDAGEPERISSEKVDTLREFGCATR